jgi:hypothetical protein
MSNANPGFVLFDSHSKERDMSRKTLYILHGVAKVFFAVALLFMPVFFHGLYGNTYSIHGIRLGRYLAVFMLVVTYLAWNYKDLPESSKEAKVFSQATMFEWGLIGVFFLVHTLQGGYNYLGWVTTGLCVFFTVMFALDGFRR